MDLLAVGFRRRRIPGLLYGFLKRAVRLSPGRMRIAEDSEQRSPVPGWTKGNHCLMAHAPLNRPPTGLHAQCLTNLLLDGYLAFCSYYCAHHRTSLETYDIIIASTP